MQAKTGAHMRESADGGFSPHGPTPSLETLDFASVLGMIFQSARIRSPSCTDSAVSALAGCASFLVAFLRMSCMHAHSQHVHCCWLPQSVPRFSCC